MEAQVPEVDEELLDAVEHIHRRPAEGIHDKADEERHHQQLQDYLERRVAEKARQCGQDRLPIEMPGLMGTAQRYVLGGYPSSRRVLSAEPACVARAIPG